MSQFVTDLFPRETEPSYRGYGITASVGNGTLHPVAMTLADAQKACWRVRRWDLTIVTTWKTWQILGWRLNNVSAVERGIIETTYERQFGTYDSITANGVSDTFLYESHLFATHIDAGDVPLAPNPPVTDTENATLSGAYWYPLFFLAFTVTDPTLPGSPTDHVSTYNDGIASQSGSMNFMGYSVPLYYSSGSTGNVSSVTLIPSTVADSYWTYAPTSGGSAIFDSTTGIQVSDNIVID